MLKRGFSMAFIVLAISILGFASFGTVVKKVYSDAEIADSITITDPQVKEIIDSAAESLSISGNITTPAGIKVDMTLLRLDGKPVVDSASGLTSLTAPKFLLEKDLNSDKEKTVLKKFTDAYEERVTAGIAFENAQSDYEKAIADKKPAAKIKELKDALDKVAGNLKAAKEVYNSASEDYIAMTTVTIFSEVAVGSGKVPLFTKSVKDIQAGYYKLIFTRKDTDKVVKTLNFEVVFKSELLKDIKK